MSIKHAEKATLWPIDNIFLCWRLHNVEHNTHSVLVVVTDDSLVSVCCVAHYIPVFPYTALSRLPAGKIESSRIRRSAVTKKELFYI
jgi:hypothetical protein